MDALIAFSTFWAYLFVFILFFPDNSRAYTENLGAALIYSLAALAAVMLQGFRTIYSRPQWWVPTWRRSHELSWNQVLWVALALCVAVVAIGDQASSRLFLFCWLPILYVCLLVANKVLPGKILETVYEGRRERTLFLGKTEPEETLAAWRAHLQQTGSELIDYMPDFSISDMANLERVMRERNVTQLVLLELPEVRFNLQYILEICDRVGSRVLLLNHLERVFSHRVTISEEAGIHFIAVKDEPLERLHNRFIKRMMDLLLASVFVLVLFPAMIVVMIAHKLVLSGPVFAREKLFGFNGQMLEVFRFRAAMEDGDVGKFGILLRRWGIDKWPRIRNVFRGEMSIVGPLAHSPEQKDEFARVLRNFHIRSEVKAGIVGLSQARGMPRNLRNEEDVVRQIHAEIEYVQNWSLGLDLSILLRSMFQGRGRSGGNRSHV